MACHLHEEFNFRRNLTQEISKSFAADTLKSGAREGESFVGDDICPSVMSLTNAP
jgi:hypothetical protein